MTKNVTNLIAFVKSQMNQYDDDSKHAVFCGMLTDSGKQYFAPNLDTYVGRAAVCAEPIVLGQVIINTEKPVYLVSIFKTGKIVMPCGICRELLMDYCPEVEIISEIDGELKLIKISDLLPFKYKRE